MDTPALLLLLALLFLFAFGLLLGSKANGFALGVPLTIGTVLLFASAVSLTESQQGDAERKLVDSAAQIASMQQESWESDGRYLDSEAALQGADPTLSKMFVGEDFFLEAAGETLVFEVGDDDQSLRVQMKAGEILSASGKEFDESNWQWPDDLIN